MSYYYDGSTEYHTVDTAAITSQSFTVSAWVRADNVDDLMGVFMIGDKDVAIRYCTVGLYGSSADGGIINASLDPTNVNEETSNTYTANTWRHLAMRLGVTADLYEVILDGDFANKGSTTNSGTQDEANWDRWGIGGYVADSTPSAFFTGYIADVGVYNSPLSDSQIGSLAEGYSPLLIAKGSLLSYYPFGGPFSIGVQDVVGGRDLSATGTPLASPGVHPKIIYPSGVI